MFDGEKCVRCGKFCKFEELTVLPSSYGVCKECALKLDPNSEPKQRCPHDGNEMRKEVIQDQVMIDRCHVCGGIWLDGGELEVIRKLAGEEAVGQWGGPGAALMYRLLNR